MKKCYSNADVLLPDFNKNDAYRWAAVACDQFTSQPEYWEKAQHEVKYLPELLHNMAEKLRK